MTKAQAKKSTHTARGVGGKFVKKVATQPAQPTQPLEETAPKIIEQAGVQVDSNLLTPWGRNGFKVEKDMSVADAMTSARLDWTVSKRQMFFNENPAAVDAEGKMLRADNIYGIVRDSDQQVMGPCGPKYVPTQNADAFGFFDRFIKAGDMKLDTIGRIDDGRHVWMLAELSNSFTLKGGDTVKGYMLLSHPHIWGKSLSILFTPIRLACMNMLARMIRSANAHADQDDGKAFRFVHRQEFNDDVKKLAEDALRISAAEMSVYQAQAELLSSRSMKAQDLDRYFAELFQPELLKEDVIDQDEFGRSMKSIFEAYETQPGKTLSNGTWWTAFNAVTYYTSHLAGKTVDSRLQSSLFGSNSNLNRRALDLALKYAA